jgi:hypothetical protein
VRTVDHILRVDFCTMTQEMRNYLEMASSTSFVQRCVSGQWGDEMEEGSRGRPNQLTSSCGSSGAP